MLPRDVQPSYCLNGPRAQSSGLPCKDTFRTLPLQTARGRGRISFNGAYFDLDIAFEAADECIGWVCLSHETRTGYGNLLNENIRHHTH